MNLCGKALFALTLFSFCNMVVQESVPTSTASNTPRTPSESKGSSTPASNTSTTKGGTSASPTVHSKTSSTTTSSPQVSTTSNATNSTTGSASLLPPISITTASMLTSAMTGLPTNSTKVARRNDTHPENDTAKSEHDSTGNDSGKTGQVLDTPSYSSIILPVIITLIVITFSVCTLVALYKICWKTTPERQENETEHTSLDKENVKLISVKTTAPQSGEHASQGKNKTRQHDDSSSHLGNKCV